MRKYFFLFFIMVLPLYGMFGGFGSFKQNKEGEASSRGRRTPPLLPLTNQDLEREREASPRIVVPLVSQLERENRSDVGEASSSGRRTPTTVIDIAALRASIKQNKEEGQQDAEELVNDAIEEITGVPLPDRPVPKRGMIIDHEEPVNVHSSKINEISRQLENPDLAPEERERLGLLLEAEKLKISFNGAQGEEIQGQAALAAQKLERKRWRRTLLKDGVHMTATALLYIGGIGYIGYQQSTHEFLLRLAGWG